MTLRGQVATYGELAARILALPSDRSRLVAIDGPGGAGKSVFATRLSRALAGAPIVQTDDFATGEPGEEWWPRLQRQVIQPLVTGRPAHYRRYDWNRRALAEWRQVPPSPAVIIEGVSSARRVFARELALAVWVHAPRAVRLARGLERDGEDARPTWEAWMADEDAYFRADDTITRCAPLVDGAPTVRHDPEREFVELESCDYE
jgi:uridine kinase